MLLTITQYRKLTDALVVRNLISKTIPVKIIYSCIDCSPAISAVIADVKNIAVCSYSGFHHCHADTVRIRLESPVYIFVADHRIPAYVRVPPEKIFFSWLRPVQPGSVPFCRVRR